MLSAMELKARRGSSSKEQLLGTITCNIAERIVDYVTYQSCSSFIEMIQGIDGFRYAERQASNKDGSAGVRFKYVCLDSVQYRARKSNARKDDEPEETDGSRKRMRKSGAGLPAYDCGGAIYVRFSTEREAVNVMYVHNPIHRDTQSSPGNGERYVAIHLLRNETRRRPVQHHQQLIHALPGSL